MKIFAFVLIFVMFIVTLVYGADKSACSLPKDVGPCRKADPVYYFNKDNNKCEEFLYGGCQGNDNRFDSKELCEKTCVEA